MSIYITCERLNYLLLALPPTSSSNLKVDDPREFFCNQTSSSNQRPVDVRLGHQFVHGLGGHGSSVLDADGVGDSGTVHVGEDAAAGCVNVLGLAGGAGEAGANGPDGLIGNHYVRHLLGGHAEEVLLQLSGADGADEALLVFGLRLADAEDAADVVVQEVEDLRDERSEARAFWS